MYRYICLLLVALSVSVFNCAADVSGKAGSNVKWTLTSDGVLTFSGTGDIKDFGRTLPYKPSSVRELIVEDGVTAIGANALSGCRNLTKVSLPASLKSIGKAAFSGCKSLITLSFPYGLESIGAQAFKDDAQLGEFDGPGSLMYVGDEAFAGCTGMTTVRLPRSLKTMGAGAFRGCHLITNASELPQFVNASNAAYYGLPTKPVEKYVARVNARQEPAAHTAARTGTAASASAKATPALPRTAAVSTASSDVDTYIPVTGKENKNTFVVIISNEDYVNVGKVPFAINDGDAFHQYCNLTLGVPESNIFHLKNATFGAINEALDDLAMANRIAGSDMKVIFYYSGHGAQKEETFEPYLMPVDAKRVTDKTCVSLNSLYDSLDKLDITSAVVFLDACFTGSDREGTAMKAADGTRPIIRAPKASSVKGKTVVFSAASKDQTAGPYKEKEHGIFTYYLLKKLQETGGNTSLLELDSYLRENVPNTAFFEGRREQMPTTTSSAALSRSWHNMRLY